MILYLFNVNWELTLFTLIPIPIIATATFFLTRRVHNIFRGARSSLSDLIVNVHDNLSGVHMIKSFTQESDQVKKIESHSKRFRDRMVRANMVSLIPAGVIELGGGLGMAVIVLWGGRMAMRGEISVADLFLFVAYLTFIYQPFLQLAGTSDMVYKAMASLERIQEILTLSSEIKNPIHPVLPSASQWDIKFDNVTFSYNQGIPVLSQVQIEVKRGKMLALVGTTGAGKTTLTRLIPRFYDPKEGRVIVNGYDVRTLSLEYLRRHVASVEQDVFLFHGTVWDNIRFGRPKAKDEEIFEAMRNANAEEFIKDLPQGHDSVIGERGIKLSGGQKQRLSIARALLKDAPILILDEATSSVDLETERLIQDALIRLTLHRTTLVIAHRLSTIRNADIIVVLDRGRVLEQGSHNELMNAGGSYQRMFRAQDLSSEWQIRKEIPS